MRDIKTLELMTLVCALGCGLIAGFFFAFSICVMKALGKLQPPHGIAAMQSINVVVINPWFLTAFFGTAVACLAAIAASLSEWDDSRAPYWLMGSAFYLTGSILVTMLCNVPRNNALAALSPSSPEAAAFWSSYLTSWTTWNHVRMIAALVAAVFFTIAFRFPS